MSFPLTCQFCPQPSAITAAEARSALARVIVKSRFPTSIPRRQTANLGGAPLMVIRTASTSYMSTPRDLNPAPLGLFWACAGAGGGVCTCGCGGGGVSTCGCGGRGGGFTRRFGGGRGRHLGFRPGGRGGRVLGPWFW